MEDFKVKKRIVLPKKDVDPNVILRPVTKLLEDGTKVVEDVPVSPDDPTVDLDYRSFTPDKVLENGYTTPVRPFVNSLDSQDDAFDAVNEVLESSGIGNFKLNEDE